MRTLPKRATVGSFNFGEIDVEKDCNCCEKGKYESIEEGIRLAVDVYVNTMQEQVHNMIFVCFVHPNHTSLDVTRKVVKQFTAVEGSCTRDT